MAAENKSRRGGSRPGAGRPKMHGEMRHQIARIETELFDLAVMAGQGEYSSGVRLLLRLAQRVLRHDASIDQPPVGESVLTFSDDGWHVGKLTETGDWQLAFDLPTSVFLNNVTVWCFLQPTPAEEPLIVLSGKQ